MPHIALLGDSVFDNAAYVGGGPDVIAQLQERLPAGWDASLQAVDGAVIGSVRRQLETLLKGATHLVVSVGGNDALGCSSILDRASRSVAESLLALADIGDTFSHDYEQMLDLIAKRDLPTAVCTIYDPRFPEPLRRRVASTALTVLNDRILRAATRRRLPVIDLRLVCSEDADFANPIEPSVQGGAKIAAAILGVVREHGWDGAAAIYGR